LRTIILLTIANIFMIFAWYGHLKYGNVSLWKVIVASWGIAFFRILLSAADEPVRLVGIHRSAAENDPGSDYADGVFYFLDRLSRRAIPMELCGRFWLHFGGRFFRVPPVIESGVSRV
jgi:Putative member of DMT superfamily (DUF486)